jgi:hypothetical protein
MLAWKDVDVLEESDGFERLHRHYAALLERPCLYLRFFRMVPGSFLVSLSIAINNTM